jgi:aminopeptidase-like protein
MGYSAPIDKTMPLGELQKHLYSLPDQPDVIPYATSYYEERFCFCLSHRERLALRDGAYRVFVDSELKDGSLTYGEIIIDGAEEDEIFFSSNICHPSMANNELSAPCAAIHLAKWLAESPRRFTYRMVFLPETIGSIVYLCKHLDYMKKNIIAGFNLSCLGDNGHFSVMASRYGNTMADRAAKSVLKGIDPEFNNYTFLNRGSDERQYCSPKADLPLCRLTRSKFGRYPEYHTSADNMDFIAPDALGQSFGFLCELVESLEANGTYETVCPCEPQLSPRGLYPTLSDRKSGYTARTMMNFLAYCDGKNDLFAISGIIGTPVSVLVPIAKNSCRSA